MYINRLIKRLQADQFHIIEMIDVDYYITDAYICNMVICYKNQVLIYFMYTLYMVFLL